MSEIDLMAELDDPCPRGCGRSADECAEAEDEGECAGSPLVQQLESERDQLRARVAQLEALVDADLEKAWRHELARVEYMAAQRGRIQQICHTPEIVYTGVDTGTAEYVRASAILEALSAEPPQPAAVDRLAAELAERDEVIADYSKVVAEMSARQERSDEKLARATRERDEARADALEWRDLVVELYDPDPCWYDHRGYCQAHGWLQEGECADARAKRLLAEKGDRRSNPEAASLGTAAATSNAGASVDETDRPQLTDLIGLDPDCGNYEQCKELEAQRDKVLAVHAEFEGRCTHCVEWCDCLDNEQCSHGNLPWPCPTAAIYAGVSHPYLTQMDALQRAAASRAGQAGGEETE